MPKKTKSNGHYLVAITLLVSIWVIPGGGSKKLKSPKEHSERGRPEFEVSGKEILQGVRKVLDAIEVHYTNASSNR